MIVELDARGGYVDLNKSLKLGRPEIRVIPDREKAAALGLDATTLAHAFFGGVREYVFMELFAREARPRPPSDGDYVSELINILFAGVVCDQAAARRRPVD